jgi:hypothetical protein
MSSKQEDERRLKIYKLTRLVFFSLIIDALSVIAASEKSLLHFFGKSSPRLRVSLRHIFLV